MVAGELQAFNELPADVRVEDIEQLAMLTELRQKWRVREDNWIVHAADKVRAAARNVPWELDTTSRQDGVSIFHFKRIQYIFFHPFVRRLFSYFFHNFRQNHPSRRVITKS